jgi:hypothetical protein
VNHAVILNPARQAKFCAHSNLLHPHRLSVATQVDHIVGIVRTVCGHHNIALDSLPGSDRLIQQAIEAISADISGFGA